MIAVVVRELTYLKILAPIMQQLHAQGAEYVLYHFDAPRGDKEYNRATLPKLKIAHHASVQNAKKVVPFANDKQLLSKMIADKITKLVSLEIWLWAKGYIQKLKKRKIKTYSILYLTDSIWQPDPACITSMDRVYYASSYTMRTHHGFINTSFHPGRDRCMGSPIFDPLPRSTEGKDILVLTPNMRSEHVGISFGSGNNFIKIIERISEHGDLILKTREKQWIPKEVEKFAKEVVDDQDIMYPPIIADLLSRCYATVMFYSSGIYEAVYAGNYVLNIPFSLKRWGWDQKKMGQYFSLQEGGLYQFSGVVNSVSQEDILKGCPIDIKRIDSAKQNLWLNKYIGSLFCGPNSSERIVRDILKE